MKIIDLGSSTVKLYEFARGKTDLVASQSFHFKKNFDVGKKALAQDEVEGLISFLKSSKFAGAPAYATGVFREIGEPQRVYLEEALAEEKIELIILTHEEESRYLERALVGRAKLDEPLMLLNIGGATTEIIYIKNDMKVESCNLEVGVGTILGKYPSINEKIRPQNTAMIQKYIISVLPKAVTRARVAIFSGGELTFMRRAGYLLRQNRLFSDPLHPRLISIDDFQKGNSKLYYSSSLIKLEKLYPENPAWTHGARSCEIIAESVFKHYNVSSIIPSDANLVDGIILEMQEVG